MFYDIMREVANYAGNLLHDMSKDGRTVINEGEASGSLVNDREVKADQEIGKILSKRFMQDRRFKYIVVEGKEPPCSINPKAEGSYVVGIDPIDGSLAYEKAEQSYGAPYTLAVTIAESREGQDILFRDIVAAVVYDYRVDDFWVSDKAWDSDQMNGTFVHSLYKGDLQKAWPSKDTIVDIGKQFVIFESYYPDTREVARKAFAGERGYLRSFCSAAWEMVNVSSGAFCAQFSTSQKHHELGAAYLIVTGAGGSVINAITGESLADSVWMKYTGIPGKEYDWNLQTCEITACNEAYAQALRTKLKPFLF